MPIIDIELVTATEVPPDSGVTCALANELGDALEAAPGKVWVRLRILSSANYAENRVKAPEPVFVTVLASAPPEGDVLRRRVTAITEIVARLTRRKQAHVHVLFEPAARGRIAFGGRLVE